MKITFNGKFKSITDFVWEEIPDFVVITGPNGSGKSQLLELIFNTVINKIGVDERVSFEDFNIEVDEVSYIQGEWQLNDTSGYSLYRKHQLLESRYQSFLGGWYQSNQRYDIGNVRSQKAYMNIQEKFGNENYRKITKEEFEKNFPQNFIENDSEMSQKIEEIFYDYKLSQVELKADGFNQDQVEKRIGKAPWKVIEDILKESKMPFRLNNPENISIRDSFTLKLINTNNGEAISFSDLSSGEKVLFSTVFYLYNSQEKRSFPKLLLLDEPDAHLHPSMSQQFLNIIKNVLVDKFRVNVIMTTHSPSTVVLAPADSVYEMSKEEPRIKKSPSKNHSVSLLTAGLVYVGEGTKYFLVEDKDDVDFYSYVYNQLVLDRIIDSDIPLVFIPASTNNKSGGKDVVQNWVKKLEDSGLQNVVHGLIDEDSGNTVSGGVYKIERYSIENYLIDPLLVFAILIDKERAPEIDGVKLTLGEEYKLKTLRAETLQKIVDYLFNLIEPELPNFFADFNETENERLDIKFTNGIVLSYPKWIINRRGKTLLNEVYNKVFTSPIVNHATLFKAMRKLNFFPLELLAKFNELKNISHE